MALQTTQGRSGKKARADIIDLAIPLFARAGYDGVSMRDIATTVGVTPAALYHHFKDKDELYIDAVGQAFRRKTSAVETIVEGDGSALQRLESFITWFAQTLGRDQDFQKLLQWVLLDSDTGRMQRLVKSTFEELFLAIQGLVEVFKPRYDPHLLSVSVIGLVLYHFETSAVRSILPGHRAEHERPETLVRHLMQLLRPGLAQ